MFTWNEDMVRFMRDAGAYNRDYYARLAAWMAPYLSPEDHLCDAGCGLGFLSLELINYVNHITAVDCSELALNVLRENASNQQNITTICGNINHFTPQQKYDDMVFSFFGKMEEIWRIAKAQCRGNVFVFKRNYVNRRFSVGECAAGDDSFQNAVTWLGENGVPFAAESLSLEMGQPLRSREEARQFFALYHRGDVSDITDDFLHERLVETGREDFPLYLPQRREVGCLRFASADLPEE